MTEHLRRHPEIREEKIERPIFIIGAPRTGTTVTHHLLSQESGFRYPLTWECDELHPPLDPPTMHHDPRIKRSEKQIRRGMKMAPNSDAAHPVGAWEAQECALLHAYAFHSDTFHVMFNCQGYARWLTEQDLRWVYEAQSGGKRPAGCSRRRRTWRTSTTSWPCAIPPIQPPSAMAGAWFVPVAWELAEDQALVIDYQIPDGSPYVGICLTDRWSAMIDV